MTTDMQLSYRAFPSGDLLAGTVVTTFPLSGGSPLTLTAQVTMFEAADPSTNPPLEYSFLFWDIDGVLYTAPPPALSTEPPKGLEPGRGISPRPAPIEQVSASFTAPTESASFQATAWYILIGGGGGGGTPELSTSAFSLDQDKVIPNSPIATVAPASARDGADAARTVTAVTIAAEPAISPYAEFQKWLQFGDATIAGADLSAGVGGSGFAIAFYAVPHPDPCQFQLDAIANWTKLNGRLRAGQSVSSVPALDALYKALVACQAAHGEVQTFPTVNGVPETL